MPHFFIPKTSENYQLALNQAIDLSSSTENWCPLKKFYL